MNNDVSFSEGQRNRAAAKGIQISLHFTDGSTYSTGSRSAHTSETHGSWSGGAAERAIEIVTVPSRRQFQAHFNKQMNSQRTWMYGAQEFARQRQFDNGFTGRLFYLHSNLGEKAQFDEQMKRVLGKEIAWEIDLADGPHGQNYYLKVRTDDQVNHSSEGLGDGIISLLYIVNALYDSTPDSILVFDEPELSLHPQMIRNLGELLSEYAASRQIVIFTHSPFLVAWDSIAAGAEIARVYKEGADSILAQVPRETIDQLPKSRGGWTNPHMLGTDATAALFLDDEIVVVEGQEDVGLLPVVFKESGVEQRGTVFGWGSGGGDGNPRRIVALLHGLGFKKVVALLDADKPGEAAWIQSRYPEYLATTIPADDIRDKPKPLKPFEGKVGLLDKDGRRVKPELLEEARKTLSSVVNYFAAD